MFIDETGASTNMARTRGRSRRGRRLRAAIPHGHYKTVTLVAGLVFYLLVERPVLVLRDRTVAKSREANAALAPSA